MMTASSVKVDAQKVPIPMGQITTDNVKQDDEQHKFNTEHISAIADVPRPNLAPPDAGGAVICSLLYLALLTLFLVQLGVILFNHSHLGGLPMFDTIFLLIVRADSVLIARRWLFHQPDPVDPTELAPLLRVVGCCAFQALLFVTLSHALEAITCADSSSHFSAPFLATVLLNILAKLPLALFWPKHLLANVSLADLSPLRRIFLHLGAPLVTLALAITNHYLSPNSCEVISRLDPYLGAIMCVLLSLTVAPIFLQNVPFLLLCDKPAGFREQEFKTEIEEKFPCLHCFHLHIMRKWPGHRFDALLHVRLQQQDSVQETMRALHALLRSKGARSVTIQPWLAVHGEQQNLEKPCCPAE